LIQTQIILNSIKAVPQSLIRQPVQLNLNQSPANTYIYDSYSNNQQELENILDRASFYSEVGSGILLSDFLSEKQLASRFIVTATFEQEGVTTI
jgi:hypothetical protein